MRAKRARDHLARKRRRARADGRPISGLGIELEPGPLDGDAAHDHACDERPGVMDRGQAPSKTQARRGGAGSDLDGPAEGRRTTASRPRPAARSTARRSGVSARAVVRATPPMPRFVVPAATLLALGLGYAVSDTLFVHGWLPRVPLMRVAVVGTRVRAPADVARALWPSAGAPLDRVDSGYVRARLTEDPWIESAQSVRLPTGTLVVRVAERRAIARYRVDPEGEVRLLDPSGRPFEGEVAAAGPLPLVEGPIDGDASLSATALEILGELDRHGALAGDPSRLTLHLPGSSGLAAPIRLNAVDVAAGALAVPGASGAAGDAGAADGEAEAAEILETLEGESGYVLAIGESGPRALLGQSFLKRRIARLARLLGERDALLARARVIDLRFADRAVLRTGPTSG
ncbi:MAG: FtsQ-type POTRA domain-containing protein [Myxococcota bacterium]